MTPAKSKHFLREISLFFTISHYFAQKFVDNDKMKCDLDKSSAKYTDGEDSVRPNYLERINFIEQEYVNNWAFLHLFMRRFFG